MFQLSMHFCLRGGEIQCKLTKKDLEFSTFDGSEVLRLATSFSSKNHQGGLAGSEWSTSGVITDPTQIAAIKRYLSKLHPEEDRLFQRALSVSKSFTDDSPSWFMRSPLSHNLLAGMMKRLSAAAGLSMEYTNHCVRATSITNMKCSGVDDRRICAVSGHKNVQSLEAYDRPTTKDACILADAIDRVAPERSVSPVAAGSSSCVPLHAAASSSSSLCVRSAGASNTAMAADSAVSNVNTSALAPYLNSASSTFTGNSIVFNIHHGRAQEARKKLKRRRSSHAALIDSHQPS